MMILIYGIVLFTDILLTWATHKLTSFLDFQPFFQGFQIINTYIPDLLLDTVDPTYHKKLIVPYHNILPIIASNWSVIGFLKSSGCAKHPYACRVKQKFDQLNLSIQGMYSMK